MEEEEGCQNQRVKRLKSEEIMKESVEEEDRISLLPDCLIIEILSRLDSTKQVIKTGVLSKRWINLWSSVPMLILNENRLKYPRRRLSVFYNLVEKSITQRRNRCPTRKLDVFKLDTRFHVKFQSNLESWIRYAINCNIHHLYLNLQPSTCDPEAVSQWEFESYSTTSRIPFVLKDELFFNNSCFTRLKLGGCKFVPTGPISWKNLTSLSILKATLDEDLIQDILSGSPLLETLELEHCDGFKRLDITSKSVKNLFFCRYLLPDSIQINAPHLLSLTINVTCLNMSKFLMLLDVSSLVRVNLEFFHHRINGELYEDMLKGYILKCSHVNDFNIGVNCSKVLSRLKAKGFTYQPVIKFPQS